MNCKTINDAVDYALDVSGRKPGRWYVNSLASSGPMKYDVSQKPITDTSFGGYCAGYAIDGSYFSDDLRAGGGNG